MVRWGLALLVMLVGAVTLSVLDADEWPQLLFMFAPTPFALLGYWIVQPVLERHDHRRRELRRAAK